MTTNRGTEIFCADYEFIGLDIIGIKLRRLPVFGTRDAAPLSAGYASHMGVFAGPPIE